MSEKLFKAFSSIRGLDHGRVFCFTDEGPNNEIYFLKFNWPRVGCFIQRSDWFTPVKFPPGSGRVGLMVEVSRDLAFGVGDPPPFPWGGFGDKEVGQEGGFMKEFLSPSSVGTQMCLRLFKGTEPAIIS